MSKETETAERVYRKAEWTPEQRSGLNAIADRFESAQPSGAQPAVTGDFGGPIPLGALHAYVQAMHRLKEIRESLGLSLSDVETRSGLTRSAISKLENGRNPNPTMATVLRYASALGKSVTLSYEDLVPA